MHFHRALYLGILCWPLLGCDISSTPDDSSKKEPVREKQTEPIKKAAVGKNVYLEIFPGDRRRVVIEAQVCRREDQLEQLLCRKRTKEHEAILTADVDARMIHAALIAAKASPGAPVQYRPYKAAHGTKIKVSVQYKDKDGKTITEPAQRWIRNVKTGKDMEYDWVFAGSRLIPPFEKGQEPYYAANDGDVICLSNFDTALLDLPVELPNANNALIFEANTERIPPVNTPVQVILEPVLEQEKGQK